MTVTITVDLNDRELQAISYVNAHADDAFCPDREAVEDWLKGLIRDEVDDAVADFTGHETDEKFDKAVAAGKETFLQQRYPTGESFAWLGLSADTSGDGLNVHHCVASFARAHHATFIAKATPFKGPEVIVLSNAPLEQWQVQAMANWHRRHN